MSGRSLGFQWEALWEMTHDRVAQDDDVGRFTVLKRVIFILIRSSKASEIAVSFPKEA